MRIRVPFAGAFFFLLLGAAYLGLSELQPLLVINDKVAHFVVFFALTICFYWILDTSRRRTLHITIITCTILLGIGSEVLQGFLPNGRIFDPYDILANFAGSLAALAICSWYHKRMLERRRLNKLYHIVPGDEEGDLGQDLELGEQGSGVTPVPTLEEQLDNWDENVEDNWDDEEPTAAESSEGDGRKSPSDGHVAEAGNADAVDVKKRTD